jgi:hypothetical protein
MWAGCNSFRAGSSGPFYEHGNDKIRRICWVAEKFSISRKSALHELTVYFPFALTSRPTATDAEWLSTFPLYLKGLIYMVVPATLYRHLTEDYDILGYNLLPWRLRWHIHLYLSGVLHGVSSRNSSITVFAAVRSSNLIRFRLAIYNVCCGAYWKNQTRLLYMCSVHHLLYDAVSF